MQDQPSTKIHKLGANSTRRISLQSGTQCIGQTRQGDSRSFWIVKATWIRILVFGAGICALSKLDNDRGQRVVTVDLDFSLRADHNSATSFCYVPLCRCAVALGKSLSIPIVTNEATVIGWYHALFRPVFRIPGQSRGENRG